MQGKPPAGATATNSFINFLRKRLEPIRTAPAEKDPSNKAPLWAVSLMTGMGRCMSCKPWKEGDICFRRVQTVFHCR